MVEDVYYHIGERQLHWEPVLKAEKEPAQLKQMVWQENKQVPIGVGCQQVAKKVVDERKIVDKKGEMVRRREEEKKEVRGWLVEKEPKKESGCYLSGVVMGNKR